MRNIKIFCMQKNEKDILKQWIDYHANIFGLSNIYLIDNLSTDGSYEIMKEYENKGLNICQRGEYIHKGDYICKLIHDVADNCDIAIPIDIDEFIGIVDMSKFPRDILQSLTDKCKLFDDVYYRKLRGSSVSSCTTSKQLLIYYIKHDFKKGILPYTENAQQAHATEEECNQVLRLYGDVIKKVFPCELISCDKTLILNHLEHIKEYGRYSFLYYLSSRNNKIDYINPLKEILYFDFLDYEEMVENENKKFFWAKRIIKIDHGNHTGIVDGLTKQEYKNSDLILFHYHFRGVRRLIEKCRNDIMGLGFVKNINNIKELQDCVKRNVIGAHNIQTYIIYLTEGPKALCKTINKCIKIDALSKVI